MNKFLLLIFGSLLFLHCSNSTNNKNHPIDKLNITLDKSVYEQEDGLIIRVENSSEETIGIKYLCGFFLEFMYQQKTDGIWGPKTYPPQPTCPSREIRQFGPGSASQDTMSVSFLNGAGTYRIILPFFWVDGDALDPDTLVSDTFRVAMSF